MERMKEREKKEKNKVSEGEKEKREIKREKTSECVAVELIVVLSLR
jgi:hypothetical protein